MQLRPSDNYPPIHFAHNMGIHVRVRLLCRPQTPVALGISHGSITHEILILDIPKVFQKPLIVGRSMLLINVVRHYRQRVQRIHASAALETRPGVCAHKTLHLRLPDKIVRTLVYVGESVDASAAQVGCGCHNLTLSKFIRSCHCIQRWPDHRVVHDVRHTLSEHVDFRVELPDAFDVFLTGLHHLLYSSRKETALELPQPRMNTTPRSYRANEQRDRTFSSPIPREQQVVLSAD